MFRIVPYPTIPTVIVLVQLFLAHAVSKKAFRLPIVQHDKMKICINTTANLSGLLYTVK